MLVIRRTEGQWVEVTHRSGDVMRFRIYDITGPPGRAHLAFDDPARHFAIQRPERHLSPPTLIARDVDRREAATTEPLCERR